jgi:hypothetical protein
MTLLRVALPGSVDESKSDIQGRTCDGKDGPVVEGAPCRLATSGGEDLGSDPILRGPHGRTGAVGAGLFYD